MVSEEYTFVAERAHIALRGVMRPLGGEAVEDTFSEANQLLLERSPWPCATA